MSERPTTINLWIDRSGVLDTARCVRTAVRVGVDRVGLFVNGLGHRDFRPFVTRGELVNDIRAFHDAQVGVDLTFWLRPNVGYIRDLVDYVGNVYLRVMDECGPVGPQTLRLDVDCESAWASGRNHKDRGRLFWDLLRDRGIPTHHVSVNDYASLQGITETLIHQSVDPMTGLGCATRPQAYSVGYVRHGRKARASENGIHFTEPGEVYWPGVTQRYAMRSQRWEQFDTSVHERQFGLAAYKPMRGMSVHDQLRVQIETALEFEPTELWFWSLDTERRYLDELADWSVRLDPDRLERWAI